MKDRHSAAWHQSARECEAATLSSQADLDSARSFAREIDRFSGLVLSAYKAAVDPQGWYEFLRMLQAELNGNAAVLMLRVPAIGQHPVAYSVGGVAELSPVYYNRYVAFDPFVQLPEGRAITIHDFLGKEVLEQSVFYREYLVPQDVHFAMGVDLRVEGRFHARLRICRGQATGNFGPADGLLCDRLVPHLRAALSIQFDRDQMLSECAFYSEAMDQLTMGTIILDEAGRVLHTNRLAEALLGERDGIAMNNDLLVVTGREENMRFKEIVARAVATRKSGRPGLVEVLRVTRPSGKSPIGLIVRPSVRRLDGEEHQFTASVAVFLNVDSDTADGNEAAGNVNVLQKLFGLTPKESALALRLASGRTLQQASDELGISQNTSRAHLRAVFAKMGIDRQTQLVRTILKSVAMLG